MSDFLSIATVVACVAVVAILALGLAGFASGRASASFSNKVMRARVLAQAVAVLLLIAFAIATQMGG